MLVYYRATVPTSPALLCRHDLNTVAGLQLDLIPPLARHDLVVHGNGNAAYGLSINAEL